MVWKAGGSKNSKQGQPTSFCLWYSIQAMHPWGGQSSHPVWASYFPLTHWWTNLVTAHLIPASHTPDPITSEKLPLCPHEALAGQLNRSHNN